MLGINTQRILNCLNGVDDKLNGTFEDDGSHYNIKMMKDILKTLKGKDFSFTYDSNGNLTLKHERGEFTFYHVTPDTEETRKNKIERKILEKKEKEERKIIEKKEREERKIAKDKEKQERKEKLLNSLISQLNKAQRNFHNFGTRDLRKVSASHNIRAEKAYNKCIALENKIKKLKEKA